MEGSPGTPGRDSRPARATGETAALSTPAQLVQDVQVARSEAVFAMAGVLHRLVSGITGGSSVLTPEQVQHLAIDMGFPITDLDAALEEMSAGEDGEVDVWEFEAWCVPQGLYNTNGLPAAFALGCTVSFATCGPHPFSALLSLF
jgi:hypothetical protein|eukprot:SAG25_NODE_986_length_4405_cov_3.451463_2_plen_145_part_00